MLDHFHVHDGLKRKPAAFKTRVHAHVFTADRYSTACDGRPEKDSGCLGSKLGIAATADTRPAY